jgi:hypothetical protein
MRVAQDALVFTVWSYLERKELKVKLNMRYEREVPPPDHWTDRERIGKSYLKYPNLTFSQ